LPVSAVVAGRVSSGVPQFLREIVCVKGSKNALMHAVVPVIGKEGWKTRMMPEPPVLPFAEV